MTERVKPKTTAEADPVAKFEEAMKELEALVQKMERGDLRLEDSLHAYERGIALAQQCKGALDTAELRVRNLMEKSGVADPEDA